MSCRRAKSLKKIKFFLNRHQNGKFILRNVIRIYAPQQKFLKFQSNKSAKRTCVRPIIKPFN